LELTKQLAHLHRATVNDVVLAAVAGGLRQLLASRGEDVRGLMQRAMVTISVHHEQPGQAQGNKPGWMMVPLPLGEPDPVRRLELIAAETAARKHKRRPEAGTGIFRFIAAQRLWYRLFPRQRSVNLVVSNAPGPPVPLYLAGARLLELFPMMPVMGNLTLVAAAVSYDGQLNLTAVADATAAQTWRCSPRACAAPSTTSRDRCLRLPLDQDANSLREMANCDRKQVGVTDRVLPAVGVSGLWGKCPPKSPEQRPICVT
jgi:uncharacterized protein DUF1298